MHFRRSLALFSSLATFLVPASAEDVLRSSSLAACQENSGFTASLFDVVFTPKDNKLSINMIATSSIEGKVLFDVAIIAYGYQITRTTLDPCNGDIAGAAGLCPMTSGKMGYPMILDLPPGAANNIPGIAYTFPDLDAVVRVFVNMTDGPQAGTRVACVETNISNGKTGMLSCAQSLRVKSLISCAHSFQLILSVLNGLRQPSRAWP